MVAYVHSARLQLELGGDIRGPGAAVTVALCGHWEHDGPCRWPHHTAVEGRSGAEVSVRTVFAADSAQEPAVRAMIVRSLRTGLVDGADGSAGWVLLAEGPAEPDDAERAMAARFVGA